MNANVGVGLFPTFAMLNHSCAPNCCFAFSPAKRAMEIRTLVPVAPGDELTVSYIDLYQSTAARRKELKATKHFLCGCARCAAPTADDAVLEGVCCGACLCAGRDPGACLLVPTAPAPTAPGGSEDELLATFGELSAKPGAKADVKQKKKKKDKKAGVAQLLPPPPPPAPAPAKVPVEKSVEDGAAVGAWLFCHRCGGRFPAVAASKAAASAAAALARAEEGPLARRDHGAAKVALNALLDAHTKVAFAPVARATPGASSSSTVASSSAAASSSSAVLLHPMHTTVFNACARLVSPSTLQPTWRHFAGVPLAVARPCDREHHR